MSDTPIQSSPPIIPGLDPELLNESEKQFIEFFERERGGKSPSDSGDDTLTSAEDDTTGTPGSASPAAPDDTPTVEGQSVSSESDQPSPVEPIAPAQPVEPPDPAAPPDEGEAPPEDQAPTSVAFTFAGIDYSPDDLARAVGLHDWYQRLDNNQIQSIDALLSGQYQLIPANQPSTQVVPPQPEPATSPAPSLGGSDDDAGEWLDPRAETEINRLRSELNQVREQFTGTVTPLVQSSQDAVFQQRLAAIDCATSSFATEHSLDDDQVQAIGRAVTQSGIFPSLVQRHNGDIEAATRASYDMMFWTTPAFRDAHVSRQAAAELATLSEHQQTERKRQEKMTALSSSGGSVPRHNPSPQNPKDRHNAMVEAIRADLNGQ